MLDELNNMITAEDDKLLAVMRREAARCQVIVGDTVAFNRPKRPLNYWTVMDIEIDPNKVKWGKRQSPMFVKIKGMVPKDGYLEVQTVWVNPKNLRRIKDIKYEANSS